MRMDTPTVKNEYAGPDTVPPKGEPSMADKLLQLAQDIKKFELDIANALEYSYGSYTLDDVIKGILAGRFHIYTLNQSFLICEYQQAPQYAIYHAFLAGGDLQDLLSMQEKIRPVAQAMKAKYATLNGRLGWKKPLEEQGWEARYLVMYKEV